MKVMEFLCSFITIMLTKEISGRQDKCSKGIQCKIDIGITTPKGKLETEQDFDFEDIKSETVVSQDKDIAQV